MYTKSRTDTCFKHKYLWSRNITQIEACKSMNTKTLPISSLAAQVWLYRLKTYKLMSSLIAILSSPDVGREVIKDGSSCFVINVFSRVGTPAECILRSSRPSFCTQVPTPQWLHGFQWNFIPGICNKFRRNIKIFFNIRQQYRALYLNTYMHFPAW
jgi:hypothetical protein